MIIVIPLILQTELHLANRILKRTEHHIGTPSLPMGKDGILLCSSIPNPFCGNDLIHQHWPFKSQKSGALKSGDAKNIKKDGFILWPLGDKHERLYLHL